MDSPFILCEEHDVVIVSFSSPTRMLSWAVLNGGFCRADHVINCHVSGSDASFCAQPRSWLQQAASVLGLKGKVVAMATAVEMQRLVRISIESGIAKVTCLVTVGCGNALSVGDPAHEVFDETAPSLHTINMILAIQPGLTNSAMVEAIQIATEGRVRALYESGIKSYQTGGPATGTGTDCIAIASLGDEVESYCGKHTKLGELIGGAAYAAVKQGLTLSESK